MATKKRSDGEGSIYQRHKTSCERPIDARGNATCKCPWQAVLVTGFRTNPAGGRPLPVRKKATAATKTGAAAKLRQMREDIANGRLPAGQVPTVGQWMTYWLTQVVPDRNRPSTIRAYSTYVNRYIIPLLGDVKLDRLSPEHLQAAWRSLAVDGCPGKDNAKPLSPTSVHQAHVILSRALKVAQQRGYVTKNAATLMDAPSISTATMEVLTKDDARKVVTVAREKRNAARWTVAFTLGLRQGEALGLRWDDVDLERSTIHVRHSLGRVTGQGLVLGEVKSRTGNRTIVLPKPLLADLKAHRTAQNAERLAAGTWWHDSGFVFAMPDGRPIDSKYDWTTWRALLSEAGVPAVRLHAARHTAITMLLALGVAPLVVKEIAGHAKFSTTEVYVDKVDELHLDAAEKMAAFWD